MDAELLLWSVLTLSFYFLGAIALLLVLIFLSFTTYLFYVHWKYSHLPQPKRPSFYFGHLPDLIRAQKESGNSELSLATIVQQWSEQIDSLIFVVFFLHEPQMYIMDAKAIKVVVMNPEYHKHPSFYSKMCNMMGERFMGKGVITILDYKTWKPRRQLYDPAFKKSYLKTLLDPFNEMTDKLLAELKPNADGVTQVPMKIKFGEFTLKVISKVAFGTDFTQQLQSNEMNLQLSSAPVRKSLTTLVDIAFKGLNKTLRVPGFKYLHPFKAAEYRQVARAIRDIGRDCIRKRIQRIEHGDQVPNDILTHILRLASNRESIDIEELVDDFVSFYVAGQETTSHLLSFALVLTLLHPNVLERVQSEVDEVLGTKSYVTAEDLEKLEYTEQVLKEALRLYGPVVGIVKEAIEGGVTLSGNYIPAKTQMILCTGVMCHMSNYFDDPETFNPSRFDPKNTQPDSFVYFPFGLGHRSCIGKHFAMMETKISFSRLLQSYKITLPEGYQLVTAQRVVIQPKDDVLCTLEPR